MVADGLRLHARLAVDAAPAGRPTVVMVHGLLVSSRYMLPTAERLAPDFPVHVPDLPGYGKSTKLPRALSVPELADGLATYLRAAGLGQVVLLANSFGCQIAADFAARYPERVARLILVGPTVDPHADTAHQQIGHWLVNLPGEPPALGLVVLRDLLDMGPRRMLATFRHMLDDHIETKLPRVAAPTLVVRGGRDTSVPQHWAEEATRLLPQARLVVVRGAAHTLNYNSPRALVRVVRAFLLDAPGGAEPTTARGAGHDAGGLL